MMLVVDGARIVLHALTELACRRELRSRSLRLGEGARLLGRESCRLANVLIAITDADAIVRADKQAQYI